MKNLLPLMQREWLQHRTAWALLVLVPLGLSLTLLTVGTIQLDDDMLAQRPRDLALMLGSLSVVITTVVLFLLLGATSLFIALSSPRRDHGDRSVEFWLSLPSGHAESLAAPMIVHLLLVPAAALLVGFVASIPVSLVVVGRVVGLGEWFSLPWGPIMGNLSALLMRVVAGLPLALLWLSPLLLAAMLANALFKRWGLPLLVVGLSLLGVGLERLFRAPLLSQALETVFTHAATSLVGAGGGKTSFEKEGMPPVEVLSALPAWALNDFGAALKQLAHPVLVGALLLAGLLFAALVLWRQRGAARG